MTHPGIHDVQHPQILPHKMQAGMSTCGFFNLPVEVRRMIYVQCFKGARVFARGKTVYSFANEYEFLNFIETFLCGFPDMDPIAEGDMWGLLSTCRQINVEARNVIFQECIFSFISIANLLETFEASNPPNVPSCFAGASWLASNPFKYIRHLWVHVELAFPEDSDKSDQDVESAFDKFQSCLPALQNLILRIRSTRYFYTRENACVLLTFRMLRLLYGIGNFHSLEILSDMYYWQSLATPHLQTAVRILSEALEPYVTCGSRAGWTDGDPGNVIKIKIIRAMVAIAVAEGEDELADKIVVEIGRVGWEEGQSG